MQTTKVCKSYRQLSFLSTPIEQSSVVMYIHFPTNSTKNLTNEKKMIVNRA